MSAISNPPPRPDRAIDKVLVEMASSLNLDEVLCAVSIGLVEELGAASVQLWLSPGDPDGEAKSASVGMLRLASSGGLAGSTEAPPRLLQVAREGEHFCTNGLPTDGSVGNPAWLLENGLRALATLPLMFRERVLGVLAVYFTQVVDDLVFQRLFLFARLAGVAIENARLFARVSELERGLRAENSYLRQEVEVEVDCGEIVGRSPAILAVMEQVNQVAATEASVLISGETGTGKELIARAIHQRSRRSERAMVKVNCGAIAAGLVESELFGHEKGAFTGALERRIGRFELAHGGTLFLDEVGELPLQTQVKLLRALQEQEIERVGSSEPLQVDVRVIAAGNLDLAAEVTAGRFRADLFYRLNVFPIRLPPLRQRKEDIPLIAGCILGKISSRVGKSLQGFGEGTLERLLAYDWPGNVRELLNVLERAAILSQGSELVVGPELLPVTRTDGTSLQLHSGNVESSQQLRSLQEVEREHLNAVLEATRWVIEGPEGAARILGLKPSTLRSRLARHGLQRPDPA